MPSFELSIISDVHVRQQVPKLLQASNKGALSLEHEKHAEQAELRQQEKVP